MKAINLIYLYSSYLFRKFSSIFVSWLYDKKAPRTFIGSLVFLNCNILELLFFIVSSHIILVFFLFSFKPEICPKESIVCRCALRDTVLLVIILLSSANSDMLTSLAFGRSMLLQFEFWRTLIANISTARVNRTGPRGHHCRTPLDILI